MKSLIKPGRIAYCIGLAGMVSPQFFYGKFGSNFFPGWTNLPFVAFWACLFAIVAIAACAAIIFEKNARTVSLVLGGFLLATYCFGYLPYEILVEPYNNYLGTWASGLKEPALAGGAFVIAGSFPREANLKNTSIKWLEKLIPFGPFLFCITMVLYGISHFLYVKPVSALVPGWIPGNIFWTYFAGAALIGLGIAIVFKIKLKLAALLLGIMIFIWLIIIHIPLAIADPFGNKSDAFISSFSALAFCATAFVISGMASKNKERAA
ncbi:MAG: hypothetical protein JWP94_1837 [Mucilaginibacter sp.]|jgi:uncharacterized membrane protein YphA (DoxX/SURF4 family)|nr:hypothetical protein [Mucilaginibacter sp.]